MRAGPRQIRARRLDRRPRHGTGQYGTTHHETPCDRRHTDVLTIRLGELGAPSNPQVTGYKIGVSDGSRTRDIQDHNLAL